MTECLFFTPAGVPLFTRADMEEGHWVQQEMSVNATFPFDMDKVIVRGMRIGFTDTATGTFELFEIRNVQNTEPDHYQQITAEHIAVAELSDEHIDSVEITDKTASAALATALTGTLWSVGNVAVNPTSSGDISRGSVWQAVCMIIKNWNVYIVPRVTLSASGSISGRYLDILQAGGTFRGLRLSIDVNMSDSAVTYDDTDVYTALYGYGAGVETTPGEDKESLTFADVVWTQTAEHPAKPSGQKYLEDPAKTALYGRNGRPRFGFYQNADISDAETLLEKTWEALKATSDPKISISGTVTDLYRLGYADIPLSLHDIAIVEIRGTGEDFQKEIINLDVDLVDPSGTQPVIGDYIPSIIYIVRDNNEKAGGGGGGGGRGNTNAEYERKEFHTDILANDYKISLSATQEDMETIDSILRQAGLEIDATTGVLIYHTDNANMLQAKLNVQADKIGLVVGSTATGNFIKAAEIVASINDAGSGIAMISADHVNIGSTTNLHALSGNFVFDPATGNVAIVSAGGLMVRKTVQGQTAEFGLFDDNNLTAGVIVDRVNDGQVIIKGSKVYVGDASTDETLTTWATDSDGLFATTINALDGRIETLETDSITTDNLSAAISDLTAVTVSSISGTAGSFTSFEAGSLSVTGKSWNSTSVLTAAGFDSDGNFYTTSATINYLG